MTHLIAQDWIPDTTPTFQEASMKALDSFRESEIFSELSKALLHKGQRHEAAVSGGEFYKATWNSNYVPVTLNIHWKD